MLTAKQAGDLYDDKNDDKQLWDSVNHHLALIEGQIRSVCKFHHQLQYNMPADNETKKQLIFELIEHGYLVTEVPATVPSHFRLQIIWPRT
ncbi:hypothetical protein [Achromobacter phage Motura]|uniref:Uncharacterized protein n=1 Tax=Achromobacter phage Motura TaxID=2591403 RepID=A0A514CTD9_9CAUD|nr:hypothetical protein H1O15_gp107 [Achromobacter phage Motura]QDH83720.1 hypothetical protein [Achromobacter phage Motura]